MAKYETDFPKEARTDKQILWIFENKLANALKLSDLQDVYNDLRGLDENGKEIKITNIARRLKNNNKLAVVKYNKQNSVRLCIKNKSKIKILFVNSK